MHVFFLLKIQNLPITRDKKKCTLPTCLYLSVPLETDRKQSRQQGRQQQRGFCQFQRKLRSAPLRFFGQHSLSEHQAHAKPDQQQRTRVGYGTMPARRALHAHLLRPDDQRGDTELSHHQVPIADAEGRPEAAERQLQPAIFSKLERIPEHTASDEPLQQH